MKYRWQIGAYWVTAMLLLGILWWKSIQAEGSINLSTRLFGIFAGMAGGSGYLLIDLEDGRDVFHVSASHTYLRRSSLDRYGDHQYETGVPGMFGRFICARRWDPCADEGVIVAMPIWFLMLAGSAFFGGLDLFHRGRVRRLGDNPPINDFPI